MNKKNSIGISIGSSSLLVVIVVLCFVCFAGLAIVSANADYRLSKKLADRTTSYYQALSEGNEQLALLAKEKEPLTEALTFSYPVSDTEALILTVEPVGSATNTSNTFFVSSFQLINTKENELDLSLKVLK